MYIHIYIYIYIYVNIFIKKSNFVIHINILSYNGTIVFNMKGFSGFCENSKILKLEQFYTD